MAGVAKKKNSKRKKPKIGDALNGGKEAVISPVVKAVKKLVKKPARKVVKKIVARAVGAVAASGASKKSSQTSVERQDHESWFWVSALYRLTPIGAASLAPERADRWERRVFVIRAVRGEERKLARRVAKAHETRHGVAKGEKAVWRLQEIESFAELFDERIEHGTEVYWHFFTRE